MVRHIVLWKLDDSYTAEEKKDIQKQLNEKLNHLTSIIKQISSLQVSFNSDAAKQTNFDILLDSAFKSFEDLKIYQEHPDHIKVGAFINSLKVQRAAIDFEY